MTGSRLRHLADWAARIVEHHPARRGGEVFQSSTIGALLDGVYDGDLTVAELLRHGDFGLGTFNRLDGEMVIIDGTCYHLRSDGSAVEAALSERTPFAAVTRFHTAHTLDIDGDTARDDLLDRIDDTLQSTNLIYAVRVDGRFAAVRTRTVRAQTPPYPPLTEASDDQAEQVFDDVGGVLIGFRTPAFEQGISVAGYHLHFLDDTRSRGGHVLDVTVHAGRVAISTASELHLRLPTTTGFLAAHLTGEDIAGRIRHAEGGG
ncbi:acetolactate decarboxylase [Mycolicibacterium sp. 018/SC-01/001]|uniref:acetolactate decarboxylase n=1 Tax=Mycolicibacterium sp. 018/SC-01/001 TaxID=2592069 RepID=UPI00117DAF24|nr:acetolactate decarboxylase [Mycolicibacterium sp. 018/SC-01/001]TRW89085.1 acetolactate decarboxylase [Mycolicibacterium sp. 018/SC-01/001]